MTVSVQNNNGSTFAPVKAPETTAQKLDKATKVLGWTTVALLVISIITVFFCPALAAVILGLGVVTAVSAGGTFFAKIITKAKDFFDNAGAKINQVAGAVQGLIKK
jgi:hypothetical protein